MVIPRPIAWVSSANGEGLVNLAPHSFFTNLTALNFPPEVSEFDEFGFTRADSQFISVPKKKGTYILYLKEYKSLFFVD
jgi:flavin reductase (DIM6/NTAB) family NADH-FMN oxidoreductase RutF